MTRLVFWKVYNQYGNTIGISTKKVLVSSAWMSYVHTGDRRKMQPPTFHPSQQIYLNAPQPQQAQGSFFHGQHQPSLAPQPSSAEFQCYVCDVTFKHKNNIKRHLSNVHGLKQCQYCQALIKIGDEYNLHVLRCDGRWPFGDLWHFRK